MSVSHESKTALIAAGVKERYIRGERVHIYKGGVSHFVPHPRDFRFKTPSVDVSSLNQILEIDVEGKTCTAEPGVSFAALIRETLKHNLLPMVVPELEGITLGGAVAGCSIESMSYRYGGFHDTCLEYEIVTGTGELLTCSAEKEPLVFGMVHGSYGTLGILTRIKFRLLPAKPFVRMVYRRFSDFKSFEAEMVERCRVGDFDFVDAIVHGPSSFVLCLGQFVDKTPYLSSYRWLNIFYKSTLTCSEDFLTTEDYCFRYDTECHWLTRRIPFMENKGVRLVVGKFVLGSTKLLKWTKRAAPVLKLQRRPDVVCDVFIPIKNLGHFFSWYKRDFDFFPLWMIPYRAPKVYEWVGSAIAKDLEGQLLVDCAIYGKENRGELDYSQLLEEKTFELKGLKTLISRNHYTKERFWTIYHRENYYHVKDRLDPKRVFSELYEKFHRPGLVERR